MVKFQITEMRRINEDGFVCDVYYTASKTDGTYSASVSSSTSFRKQPQESFIPYHQLTEEIVAGWVKDKIGVDDVAQIEESLDNNIEDQKSPKVEHGMPWAST
jgi:hypothetical protein